MSYDDICTTIKELHEKIESINESMQKNTGLGPRGDGLEKVEGEKGARHAEAIAQNSELKKKLVEAYNDLGRAYQQEDDECNAKIYFDQAKRY